MDGKVVDLNASIKVTSGKIYLVKSEGLCDVDARFHDRIKIHRTIFTRTLATRGEHFPN